MIEPDGENRKTKGSGEDIEMQSNSSNAGLIKQNYSLSGQHMTFLGQLLSLNAAHHCDHSEDLHNKPKMVMTLETHT